MTTASPATDYILLCDIGGTHARIAQLSAARQGSPATDFHHVEKFETCAFENLETLILHYINTHDLTPHHLKRIMIASAVRPQNNIVQFDTSIKSTSWRIDPMQIAKCLALPSANVQIYLDTHAQFMGADSTNLTSDDIICVKPAHDRDYNKDEQSELLISIGTGLGQAYGNAYTGQYIATSGGHMPPLPNNTEHQDILRYITAHKTGRTQLIYEDVVSGRGFYNLYLYANHSLSQTPQAPDMNTLSSMIADIKDTDIMRETARLFFEFLGLYMNMNALCTHSYRRITLVGGLLRQLHELDLFDHEALRRGFELDMVDSVKARLKAVEINLITKPHLSLTGLLSMHHSPATPSSSQHEA